MARLGQALALMLVVSTTLLTAQPATAARPQHWFSSPTHNIGCYINTKGARCDISTHTYKAPAKPAGCPADWGDAIEVARRAGFVCHGDTTLGAKYVLKYGHQVRFGNKVCISRRGGVVCKNVDSGHGFRISKASYQIW